MSERVYAWKRFWCHRQGNINLADDGYLYDPDAEWGKAYNPDLVSLEEIADVPCLILLGEPGIGKSQELGNLKTLTEKKICDPHQVLEINLRSCTDLKEDLFKDDTFINWVGDTYHLYLFLDSLDEGILSVPNIATGLIDELSKNKYQNHFNRLHIRIACRTFIFPAILEEGLKKLWQEDRIAIYELAPLRRVDVIDAANADHLSSCDFLKEVGQKNVVSLAIKPLSLRFLLNTYRHHDAQFPPNQKIDELYLKGCELLCTEINSSRQSSNRTGNLNSKQRLIVAARIAAITIFTNRFSVWTTTDLGNVPIEDVLLQELCTGRENSNGREFDITETVIKEVLDTGLFSSRGLYRMGWAHQVYAEFLAAWYLKQHEIPLEQIIKLISSSEDPDRKLIPQLHETAAWLASMIADVFQEIIKTDPDVLLRSDIPTDASVRKLIVDNLLQQYETGNLFDRDRNNYRNYVKLNHSELANQLRPYIYNSSKQIDARDLAIDIAEVCERSELQEDLLNLSLDSSQPIYLRASAARAISSIGDEKCKLKLKPLAIGQIATDEDDQLKGYALRAVWPHHLTAKELFSSISPPKQGNFVGSYHVFTDYELVQKLQPNDLLIALKWLERQGIRDIGHPFDGLGDAILFKAWENFELEGVLASFTRLALVQWRAYQNITTYGSKIEQQFTSSFLKDIEKRHQLIEQAVSIISQISEDLYYLFSQSRNNILTSNDILWMLGHIQKSHSEQEQKVWARLIKRTFRIPEMMPEEAKVILEITQINSILHDEFSSWIKVIDLDSPDAVKIYTDYLQEQAWQSQDRERDTLLEPPPDKRLINCLDSFESGNLQAWFDLNLQITLLTTSKYYKHICEDPDLTYLPGWENADGLTRTRIINAAEIIVQNWRSESSGVELYENDVAGYKALRLLLSEKYSCLANITTEVWKQFARIIPLLYTYTSDSRYVDRHHMLMKEVYTRVPDEIISILMALIDKDNAQYNDVYILNAFKECWDDKFLSALSKKITDQALSPKSLGKLLEELLKHDSIIAKDVAKSLIFVPLPLDENKYEKAIIASRLLIENSDSCSWLFIWSLIQQDSSFGRKIIEYPGSRYLYNTQFKLNETQLADLYLWLVHQYPYDEDPCHKNDTGFHSVSIREDIVRMRDTALSQLRDKGTLQACTEIQRLSQQLPEITWLGRTLIDAKVNMRRKTWQPPRPEDILQIVDYQRKKLMTEQSNPNFSGATFNAPVNFASNYGNQAQNISIENTEQNFDLILADLTQFINDLQVEHPNVNTPELATQTIASQAKKLSPARWQKFLNFKRLFNGGKKATLEVSKHFAENSVWGKGLIGFLEGVSDDI